MALPCPIAGLLKKGSAPLKDVSVLCPPSYSIERICNLIPYISSATSVLKSTLIFLPNHALFEVYFTLLCSATATMKFKQLLFLASLVTAAPVSNPDATEAVVNSRFATYENGMVERDTPKAAVNSRFATYENGMETRETEPEPEKAVVNSRFVTYEDGLGARESESGAEPENAVVNTRFATYGDGNLN